MRDDWCAEIRVNTSINLDEVSKEINGFINNKIDERVEQLLKYIDNDLKELNNLSDTWKLKEVIIFVKAIRNKIVGVMK